MKKYIALLFPVLLAIFTISCDSEGQKTKVSTDIATDIATDNEEPIEAEAPASKYLHDSLILPEADVVIYTSFGTMQVKLYEETPLHRENFLKLAGEGFFDGTLFHRIIKEFMIQGGDPDSKGAASHVQLGNGGPGYTIPAEFNRHLLHKRGALSAARMGDHANPNKESSGSQFYIVQGKPSSNEELTQMEIQKKIPYTLEERRMYRTVGGTPFLDFDYTVFGEILTGFDVLDKIAAVETNQNDRPLQDVTMEIKLVEREIIEE